MRSWRKHAGSVAIAILCAPALFAQGPPIVAVAVDGERNWVIAASQVGLTLRPIDRPRDVVRTVPLDFDPNGVSLRADLGLLAVSGGAPGQYGSVALLDWPQLEPVRQWLGHSDTIYKVDWLDDDHLVTAGDRRAVLWSTAGRPLQEWAGHANRVTSLAAAHDGSWLATAGVDSSIRIWKRGETENRRVLNNHLDAVRGLAVAPGTDFPGWLASASDDRTVRFWQPLTGRMVRFARLPSSPLAIAWTENGTLLAAACRDGRIRWIDPQTAQILRDQPALAGWAHAIAALPGGRGFLVGGDAGELVAVHSDGAGK